MRFSRKLALSVSLGLTLLVAVVYPPAAPLIKAVTAAVIDAAVCGEGEQSDDCAVMEGND